MEPSEPAGADPHDEAFVSGLMDTDLYSLGALFSDEHPDLVEGVLERSQQIEALGLVEYARRERLPAAECFDTLLTGLALRYYRAVSG